MAALGMVLHAQEVGGPFVFQRTGANGSGGKGDARCSACPVGSDPSPADALSVSGRLGLWMS
jgi:hypothetical protein